MCTHCGELWKSCDFVQTRMNTAQQAVQTFCANCTGWCAECANVESNPDLQWLLIYKLYASTCARSLLKTSMICTRCGRTPMCVATCGTTSSSTMNASQRRSIAASRASTSTSSG